MKVLIFISYQDREYIWEELTKKQKEDFRQKLNKQTADKLCYS